MFLVRIETDVWGGDTGKCKKWERGFREQYKNSSYIEKQSRDAQEDLLQEKKENLPNLHSHSLSLVVFGAGFLVAQLVLICLPPNHCPPICWMAFSASWLHKASTEEKKQDICKHYQIQYGNPVSDLSEKSEPVSDSSNTVIIYTLTHLLKKETKP